VTLTEGPSKSFCSYFVSTFSAVLSFETRLLLLRSISLPFRLFLRRAVQIILPCFGQAVLLLHPMTPARAGASDANLAVGDTLSNLLRLVIPTIIHHTTCSLGRIAVMSSFDRPVPAHQRNNCRRPRGRSCLVSSYLAGACFQCSPYISDIL